MGRIVRFAIVLEELCRPYFLRPFFHHSFLIEFLKKVLATQAYSEDFCKHKNTLPLELYHSMLEHHMPKLAKTSAFGFVVTDGRQPINAFRTRLQKFFRRFGSKKF